MLDIFDEENTLDAMRPKIARLEKHLARIATLPHVGHVRQRGLIAAVELVRDQAAKEPYPWAEQRGMRVCRYARTRGVWLRPLGNVLVVMPPLSISIEQLDRIMEAIEEGILISLGDECAAPSAISRDRPPLPPDDRTNFHTF